MLEKIEFTKKIMALPVWDTHNHLDGSNFLKAQNFWDMGHYFWMVRELQGVGYPHEPNLLPEKERAISFMAAFNQCKNTHWNFIFRQTIKDLFDIDLKTEKDIFAVNEKLKETRDDSGWAPTVCKRAGIKKIVIKPTYKDNGLAEIKDLHYYYNFLNMCPSVEAVLSASDAKEEAEKAIEECKQKIDDAIANGVRVFRTNLPFVTGDEGYCTTKVTLSGTEDSEWKVKQFIGHAIMEYLSGKNIHLQLFLGMASMNPNYKPQTKAHRHCAQNDTHRLSNIADIFDLYNTINFEIVNAAELSSLDIVQMARIFKNVFPGGLWWFNFRRSTYQANMQYRVEALPACRSTILASDARCIEWLYVKTMLVKRYLAEFMTKQIDDGWLTEEVALETARWWLHDSAKKLYEKEG